MLILIILGVEFLLNGCNCDSPTIISRFDLNDTKQTIFPTLDPDIAEDAKLTAVNQMIFYSFFFFK